MPYAKPYAKARAFGTKVITFLESGYQNCSGTRLSFQSSNCVLTSVIDRKNIIYCNLLLDGEGIAAIPFGVDY